MPISEGTKTADRSLLIRPYDAMRDLDRCMAIWRQASEFGHPFLDASTLDTDASLVREQYMPAADIRVAEIEGNSCGFIALLGSFIGGLFVDPSRHSQGVGRALVLEAKQRHPSLSVEVYEANEGARAFYAKVGFVSTGRREVDDQDRPLPLIEMRMGGDGGQ